MESSKKKPRHKNIGIERLQGDTYRSLFNLARICRAYELRSHNVRVVAQVKEILSKSDVASLVAEWDDQKLSKYFYLHFMQKSAPSEPARRKREIVLIVSGCCDDADPMVRQMELTRGLGCYLEERLGRPLTHPFGARPARPSEVSVDSTRKRPRVDAGGAGKQMLDTDVDDDTESEEEDTTAESSSGKDIERQDKKLAACAQEDIGESSTVDPAIESS